MRTEIMGLKNSVSFAWLLAAVPTIYGVWGAIESPRGEVPRGDSIRTQTPMTVRSFGDYVLDRDAPEEELIDTLPV